MKFVEKGWGHELWIHNSEKYCGKLLYFKKGKRCSFHYHKVKHETFYLQSGRMTLRVIPLKDMTETTAPIPTVELHPGDVYELPPETVHQMIAHEDSELFEFSTQHFDEDSIRLIKGD